MSELSIYTLYNNPKDFPGEWVFRRHVATEKGSFPDKDISARGATREEAHQNLIAEIPTAQQLCWLERDPKDDPCIAGVLL